ncbi:hypothetical protein D3875_21305 [Deinococcus cavernae]|uniref:Uncharacterized protein n=1 Tax=Deinococcus cavernae TaxID=2320857 RepID=A0A418UZG8_9DEIO|nr:SUKH-3 domain-containing protein [Deinococcus cavernae]RJF68895.1 hypothetical protein D3875_21305 [Deinococcus cavernae]
MTFTITEELKDQLIFLGWSEGENRLSPDTVNEVEKAGWKIFPAAEEFLREFEGLGSWAGVILDSLDAGTNWTYFDQEDPLQVLEENRRIEHFYLGRIYPIGCFNGWAPYFINESGFIFCIVGDISHPIASTPQGCIEKLFADMTWVRQSELQQRENQ